jgi:hypothetical protein
MQNFQVWGIQHMVQVVALFLFLVWLRLSFSLRVQADPLSAHGATQTWKTASRSEQSPIGTCG